MRRYVVGNWKVSNSSAQLPRVVLTLSIELLNPSQKEALTETVIQPTEPHASSGLTEEEERELEELLTED